MKSVLMLRILCVALSAAVCSAGAEENTARVDSYGDPLPAGAIGRLGTLRMKHGDSTFSVAYSPTGKVFATGGGRDGKIALWNVKTGKRVATLTGHKSAIACLAFSSDGKTLASGGYDKKVRLWDVAAGKETQHTLVKNRISTLAFHPDGKVLVFNSGTKLHLWHPARPKDAPVVLEGHKKQKTPPILAAAFLPDGGIVSGCHDKTIRFWDAATGKQTDKIDSPGGAIASLAVSPDGKLLACGCKDGKVHLWSLEKKKEIFVLEGHKLVVSCLAFSPDGKTLAANSGGDYTVRLWDLATKKEIGRLPGSGGKRNCMAFSPDGKTLAILRADKSVGLWNVKTGKPVHEFAGHTDQIYALAFSPDGKRLASGAVSSALGSKAGIDNNIRIWDVPRRREIISWPAHGTRGPNTLAWMPDGKAIVSCGAEIFAGMWDAKTGKPLRAFGPHKRYISSVAVSPDGRTVATGGSNDGKVYLWNAATGKRLGKWEGKLGRNIKLAFAGDGKALAASDSAAIRIWCIPPDKSVTRCSGLGGFIPQIGFSPNGKLVVSAGHSGRIAISDAVSGKRISIMTHVGGVNGIVFSPDGKLIASAGRDKVVRVWETATGKQVLSFTGHIANVNAVAFSPDGRTLASASADTTILLWNIDPWVCRNDRDKTPPLKMDDFKPAYLWDKLKGKEESSDHNEYAIMWVLVRAGDKAVGLLDIFLKPVHVNGESVKRLIGQLDDDKYKVRKRASEELAGFGNAIDSDIREALKKPTSLEARIRLEELLKVASYPLPRTPEVLRKCRSVQILEWIGTKKAQGVLKKLAAGHAGASLTQDAKSALARIASRNRYEAHQRRINSAKAHLQSP